MVKKRSDFVWVIAYIKRDFIDRVEQDLLENGYGAIKVYIPTVRVLKKQFKNRNIYEYVPLLFNYGFFQLPFEKACDAEFLRLLRVNIPAIYSWVPDPIMALKDNPKLRYDNLKGQTNVALATEKEIATLLRASENMSVFSDGLIDQLHEGQTITLKGYPYDEMIAEIVQINKKTKKVKVRLLLETYITQAVVSFENIFYTVYSNYEEGCREKSLDELDSLGKRNLDKIYANLYYGEQD